MILAYKHSEMRKEPPPLATTGTRQRLVGGQDCSTARKLSCAEVSAGTSANHPAHTCAHVRTCKIHMWDVHAVG